MNVKKDFLAVKNISALAVLFFFCFSCLQKASACEPLPAGSPSLNQYIGHPANYPIQVQAFSFTFFDAVSFQISSKFAAGNGCELASKISELNEGDYFPMVAKIGDWMVGQSYSCDDDGCYDEGIIVYNTVSGEVGGCFTEGQQEGQNEDFSFKIPGENLVIFGSKNGGYMINLNVGNTRQLPGYVYGCGSPTQDALQVLSRWQFFDQMMAPANRLGE